MKTSFFLILTFNLMAIIFIAILPVSPVNAAQEVGKWRSDFVPCEWIGEGYYEHECHPYGPYPVCVNQSCTGYVSNPTD